MGGSSIPIVEAVVAQSALSFGTMLLKFHACANTDGWSLLAKLSMVAHCICTHIYYTNMT